ncbi:MAG: exodeoxyribonuclease III [Candidatus Marinimicrobia bacterium]|nr:exodeoxyribonuclease III [Candidatus Neomarinimicrobiota bacterium]|tara:strand:+ start:12871 stop:13632 length:762 start_codon:yes stop_codon:yes gene_type:complete
MKIISFNVNGIRAVIKKGFYNFVNEHKPDILCLQEIKAMKEQVDLQLPFYPYHYWNSAEKKGYSGTAIFSKIKPLNYFYGLGIKKHDHEGRVITLEFKDYYLVTVYTPNSKRELLRLDYRQKEWDVDFLKYLKNLENKKPVIFCGDLNVAHKEIDLKNPKNNTRNPGFTIEEREGFDNYINAGFIDTFREFTKEGGHYTWWSYMFQSRQKDIGWRIDYFCISQVLRSQLKKSYILKEVMGSDHAPVVMEINDK